MIYTLIVSLSLGIISYYALVWKALDTTKTTVVGYSEDFTQMKSIISDMSRLIIKFEQRFITIEDLISKANSRMLTLENAIREQKSDSARLVEWLAEEDKRRTTFQEELVRSLKNDDREKRIIELANRFGQVIKKQ